MPARFCTGNSPMIWSPYLEGQAQLSAYCLPKGQTIASFLIWREADNHYRILLPADVLKRVFKRLQMFRLRAAVEIHDATDAWVFLGQYAQPADADVWMNPLPEQPLALGRTTEGMALRWPGAQPRWLILLSADTDLSQVPQDTQARWQRWDIEDGLPFLREGSCEQFVPQHINLDLLNAISFSKGCYPGQEVVARMHYRGRIKHRAYRFASDTSHLEPGVEIWPVDDKRPCGHIVSSWSAHDEGSQILACLRITDAARTLRASIADGVALTPLSLPYALTEPMEE